MKASIRSVACSVLLGALTLTATSAFAAPGDPVNQFNFDAKEVALQSGKTILAGTADNGDLGLIRLNADGSPDPSFDMDGFVRADFGGSEQAADIALTLGGKIVIAGTQNPGATPVAVLASFNLDGSPDTNFSGDGKATLALDANDVVTSVDVSSGGRVALGISAGLEDFKAIAFTAAGAPDAGFGASGVVVENVGANDQTTAVAFQSTGKLIVAGGTTKNTGDFAIVRLGLNGGLDHLGDADVGIGFGTCNCGTEEVDASAGEADRVLGMAIDSSDRIVLTGRTGTDINNRPVSGTVRLAVNGARDMTFATDGMAEFPEGLLSHVAEDVAVAGNGNIIVAGIGSESTGLGYVQKLSDAGAQTFASTDTGVTVPYDTLTSMRVAAAADGGFTLVGGATEYPSGIPGAFAQRFTSANALDPTLAGDGTIFPRFLEYTAPAAETPAVTPAVAGPTGQRAAALKKCKKKKTKKARKKCKRRAKLLPI